MRNAVGHGAVDSPPNPKRLISWPQTFRGQTCQTGPIHAVMHSAHAGPYGMQAAFPRQVNAKPARRSGRSVGSKRCILHDTLAQPSDQSQPQRGGLVRRTVVAAKSVTAGRAVPGALVSYHAHRRSIHLTPGLWVAGGMPEGGRNSNNLRPNWLDWDQGSKGPDAFRQTRAVTDVSTTIL
jgi:hypothetical protein